MGKSTVFKNNLLLLIFNNTPIADVGDVSGILGSGTTGSLYLSLHTSDPSTGAQSTSETAYTGYTRKPIARTGGGFIVTANIVTLAANVNFPDCVGSPGGAITHIGVGTDVSGAGHLLFAGAVSPSITMNLGVIPQVTTASTITEV